jgi:hypothetical protein
MRLLLHLHGKPCQPPLSNPYLEIPLLNLILRRRLLSRPSQKPMSLVSRHLLHLPSTTMKRNWRVVKVMRVVRGDEVEAANEAQPEGARGAEVAIVERAGTGNQSDPEKIVENETKMLAHERAETAMIDGVMILEIMMISVVGIAESGMTGVGVQARTGHVLVLETDEEQATVHAVVAERGESVIVVAIEYVQPALPLETLNSKNGN